MRKTLATWILLWLALSVAARAEVQDAGHVQPVLVEIVVNDESYPVSRVWQSSSSHSLLVPVDQLKRWRIALPVDTATIKQHGDICADLSGITGLQWTIQESTLRLVINVPPAMLLPVRLQARDFVKNDENPLHPLPSGSGSYVNYAVTEGVSKGDSRIVNSGLFQIAGFGTFGLASQSWFATNNPSMNRQIRLESTWSLDDPAKIRSIRLGDTTAQATPWEGAYRFAGIQVSRDFATQPDLVTTPFPNISGQVALPSTVQIYVNNVLQGQGKIPPGPFVINNIPAVNGQGHIQLVVTDILGRQQVVSSSFYNATSLLRAGLTDYAFEAGLLRENYGVQSNDYRTPFAAATYSMGLTDDITARVHADLTSSSLMAGVDASWSSQLGLLNLGFGLSGASHTEGAAHAGYAGTLSIQHVSQSFGFTASSFIASTGFATPSTTPAALALQRQLSATANYSFGHGEGVFATFAGIRYAGQANTTVTSVGYSMPLGHRGFVSAGFSDQIGGSRTRTASLIYTRPLSERGSYVTVGFNHQPESNERQADLYTQITRPRPQGEGYGYDIRVDNQFNSYMSGTQQGQYGTVMLSAYQQRRQQNATVELDGSIGIIEGHPFISRPIGRGFAMVDLNGASGVNVFQDNQLVGKTDSDGRIIVTTLRPYERNVLSIDPLALPLDAQLQSAHAAVVPYNGSGAIADFHITRNLFAQLALVREDGSPVPVSSSIELNDAALAMPVGFEGRMYLTGLRPHNNLVVRWESGACSIEFNADISSHKVLNLGTRTCRALKTP